MGKRKVSLREAGAMLHSSCRRPSTFTGSGKRLNYNDAARDRRRDRKERDRREGWVRLSNEEQEEMAQRYYENNRRYTREYQGGGGDKDETLLNFAEHMKYLATEISSVSRVNDLERASSRMRRFIAAHPSVKKRHNKGLRLYDDVHFRDEGIGWDNYEYRRVYDSVLRDVGSSVETTTVDDEGVETTVSTHVPMVEFREISEDIYSEDEKFTIEEKDKIISAHELLDSVMETPGEIGKIEIRNRYDVMKEYVELNKHRFVDSDKPTDGTGRYIDAPNVSNETRQYNEVRNHDVKEPVAGEKTKVHQNKWTKMLDL